MHGRAHECLEKELKNNEKSHAEQNVGIIPGMSGSLRRVLAAARSWCQAIRLVRGFGSVLYPARSDPLLPTMHS
jgi:hypothetical protein